jgi:hypothetical protein
MENLSASCIFIHLVHLVITRRLYKLQSSAVLVYLFERYIILAQFIKTYSK